MCWKISSIENLVLFSAVKEVKKSVKRYDSVITVTLVADFLKLKHIVICDSVNF